MSLTIWSLAGIFLAILNSVGWYDQTMLQNDGILEVVIHVLTGMTKSCGGGFEKLRVMKEVTAQFNANAQRRIQISNH